MQQQLSNLDWRGIKPERFHHTEKLHLVPQDSLKGFEGGEYVAARGRKHYDPGFGQQQLWKPHLRVDLERPMESNTVEFPPGKKLLQLKPSQKPPRRERLHLQEGKSGHIEDIPYGIMTGIEITKPQNYDIENVMTRKNRVGDLFDHRNQLPLSAPGDKNYKHPDYSADYFKYGGLVPGANISQRKVNIHQLQDEEMEKRLKTVSQKIPRGTKWSDRLKMDARKFDEDAIDELDKWVETTLKEANPNYKDPDLFFENLEKQNEKGGANKDTKKAGKK